MKRLASLTVLFGLLLSTSASAEDVSTSYIVGTWVTEGAKCRDASAELVRFEAGGSVVAIRAGAAEAAGFWRVEDGLLRLDLLARPELFLDEPESFKGSIQRFHVVVVARDVEEDSFEAIGVLAEETKRSAFTRCD